MIHSKFKIETGNPNKEKHLKNYQNKKKTQTECDLLIQGISTIVQDLFLVAEEDMIAVW